MDRSSDYSERHCRQPHRVGPHPMQITALLAGRAELAAEKIGVGRNFAQLRLSDRKGSGAFLRQLYSGGVELLRRRKDIQKGDGRQGKKKTPNQVGHVADVAKQRHDIGCAGILPESCVERRKRHSAKRIKSISTANTYFVAATLKQVIGMVAVALHCAVASALALTVSDEFVALDGLWWCLPVRVFVESL